MAPRNKLLIIIMIIIIIYNIYIVNLYTRNVLISQTILKENIMTDLSIFIIFLKRDFKCHSVIGR